MGSTDVLYVEAWIPSILFRGMKKHLRNGCDDEDEPTITFNMPALIEHQPIPEIEEHPYVGDSVGGVEYVSGFLSIKII